MENNENTTAVDTAKSEVDTKKSTDNFDYKAEAEKQKREKDKACADAADWKKKYLEVASDVEKQRIASEEREAHYREIEREYNLGKLENSLSKSISDEKVVKSFATKLLDGDNMGAVEELNKYLKSHYENIQKQVKEELLRDNPTPPPVNSTGGGITKEAFDKMTYQEKLELYNKDKATYDKLKR